MVKEVDDQMREAQRKEDEEKRRHAKARWEKLKRRASKLFSVVLVTLFVGAAGFLAWQLIPCMSNPLRSNCPSTTEFVAEYSTLFGADCRKGLAENEKGRCIDLFYVTTREYEALDKEERNKKKGSHIFFTDERSDKIEMGRASVSTPYVFPTRVHGEKDEVCEITADGKERKCKKVRGSGEDIIEKNREDYKEIRNEDYADYFAFARDASQSSELKIAEKLDVFKKTESRSKQVEKDKIAKGQWTEETDSKRYGKFFDGVETAMVREAGKNEGGKKSVLIYVHGFQTTFEDSLTAASYLAADLNWYVNEHKGAERNLALGAPIVFSWPTLSIINRSQNDDNSTGVIPVVITPKVKESVAFKALSKAVGPYLVLKGAEATAIAGLNYYESQLRADVDSERFAAFVEKLASSTDVEQINIVAHSMGSRIILQNLEILYGSNLNNKSGNSINIRIVQAAADIGREQFKEKLKHPPQKENSRIIAYSSEEDVALAFSSFMQENKRDLIDLFKDLGGFNEVMERIDTLLDLAPYSSKDEWYKEDKCRLGRAGDDCGFIQIDDNSFELIDASGFRRNVRRDAGDDWKGIPDNIAEYLLAHGYFLYSPMILSDMSCALQGIEAGGEGNKQRWLERPDGKTHWKFKEVGKADDNSGFAKCASTGRRLVGVKFRDLKPVSKAVYFDVMGTYACADPVDNDIAGAPPLQFSPCEAAGGDVSVKELIEEAKFNIDGRKNVQLRIAITGYADASDVTQEQERKYDNNKLSCDRVEATKTLLIAELEGADLIDRATIEAKCGGVIPPGTQTGPEKRDKNNRRADIKIRFEKK